MRLGLLGVLSVVSSCLLSAGCISVSDSSESSTVLPASGPAGGSASGSASGPASTRPSEADDGAAATAGEATTDDPKADALALAKKAAKRERLGRELLIAQHKVDRTRLELTHAEADGTEQMRKASAAHVVAVRKLADFEERSAPLRLERARLALKRAQDSHQESREELQQLEMMYSEEELGDKTAEIVITRANRRLDRARWNLEIQTTDLRNLEEETIPLERMELELGVSDKAAAIDARKRSIHADAIARRIAVLSAESDIARIRSDLATLELESTP